MASDGEKLGEGVMEQNGTKYVPLKAAMTALGGTAEFDGKKTWTVKYNDTETTVTTNGKFKIDGKRVKGDDFTVWLDEEKDGFISPLRRLRRSSAETIPISATVRSRSRRSRSTVWTARKPISTRCAAV